MFKQSLYKYNSEIGTLTINGKCEIVNRDNIIKAVCGIYPDAPYFTMLKHVIFENQEFIITIGELAFHNCRGVQIIDIPNKVTRIEKNAFNNCQGLKGPLTLPSELDFLGECAFLGCFELTGNLILPQSLTRIRERTFAGCVKLSGTLEIPPKISLIYDSAFFRCSGFEKLILNENIVGIYNSAFMSCVGLKEIHCKSISPPKLGENVFYNVDKKSCILKIPKGIDVLNAYTKAEQWKDFIITEQY